MNTPNALLTAKSREQLAGKWSEPVLAYLVYLAITSVGGPIGFIIGGPMSLGSSVFSLNFIRGKKAEVAQILDGFKNFAESLIAYLLVALFTSLWALLFIIPGIVVAISYSQTFFLMADDKALRATEAMKKSQELMKGKKWKFFCLGFRFLGWVVLAALTIGIGFIWLTPYVNITLANFYEDIK